MTLSDFKVVLASILVLAVAAATGCKKELSLDQPDLGLKDVAFQVMVRDESIIPKTGTYTWGPKHFRLAEGLDVDIAATDELLSELIRDALAKEGYTEAPDGATGDVIVGYAIAVDTTLNDEEFSKAYGEDFAVNFPVFPPSTGGHTYRSGALLLDVIDSKESVLLWRGAIMANVDHTASIETKKKRTAHAIAILMDHFPQPHVQ